MKIGIDAEVHPDTMSVVDLARAVEDVGLESLLFMQRTHLPSARRELLKEPGHEMDADLMDPFAALGAAAAVTSRIRLGTGACYAAVYDPIILANEVATLDRLSNGRILFGITPGWDEVEVRNHGVDPDLRWDVMREKVLAMKALWATDDAEFHGRFVDFEPVVLGVQPVQRPGPPILIGSHGARGRRHVAEYGDEWFPVYSDELDLVAEMGQLARQCAETGREPVRVTVFLWVGAGLALGQFDERAVERCAEAGVHRCVFGLYPKERGVVDELLERCAALAQRFEG